ncbi:MAG: hypothetical protein OJF50_000151 [Nitrospira sp.]|jgi:hypothetical protein|nr:hypothetical protein [Nitrospira sp.]
MTNHPSKRLTNACALLVAFGLSACSFVAAPPADLLAKNDHVALAAWYENEAARLSEKAKEMDQMVEEYRKDPERAQRMMSHGSPKVDFVQQCKILAAAYRSTAREAETLARSHRDMMP